MSSQRASIPRTRSAVRRPLFALCVGLAGLIVVGTVLPPILYPLWMVRFFARELALFGGLLAALGLGLWLRSRAGQTTALRWLGIALCTGLLLLLSRPLLTALPLFRHQQMWFSPWQYLRIAAPSPKPSRIIEERDVALSADRPDLRVDVYRPSADSTNRVAPVGSAVVVVHGGSFQRGDKGDVPQVSRALSDIGYVVFDLRYRLAPQARFPAAVQDILCIVGRLAEPAAQQRYGIHRQRIALLGRSAGGTLVLSAAYAAALQQASGPSDIDRPALGAGCAVVDVVPAAVIALYPWTDLAQVYASPPRPDPLSTREVMEAYLGGSPAQLPGPYRHGSPTFYATTRKPLPATLLIHGKDDSLVPAQQSALLARALIDHGHAVTQVEIPLAEHGFDHRAGGVAEQLARAAIPLFLSHALATR